MGDGDGSTREDEEEDGFFGACQGTAGNWLSLCSASESGQCRGGTEDNPAGPVTLSAVLTIGGSRTISRKATTVDFSCTISLDSADLDNGSGST